MHRELRVRVDRATWPRRGPPRFPQQFEPGFEDYALHVPGMLLMIGFLTTPTAATGVTLSEFWAWVRYLAAVTATPDLRLTSSFSTLDAHQKTILSDDFGMGAPMAWLTERLDLQDICDGRYFVERIAAGLGATTHKTAKRGPNKTPDFVARDAAGVWHVIECKGTQSGPDYLRTQMGLTKGVAQKRAIVFPPAYTGQRLVAGLSIAAEGSAFASELVITDPEPENPFKVAATALGFAEDAAARAVVARSLRLAGFEIAAEATAAPFGSRASDQPSRSRRREEERKSRTEERNARAREELVGTAAGPSTSSDGRFRGRTLEFDLPRPIETDDGRVTRMSVQQRVNRDVLAELAEKPTEEGLLPDVKPGWAEARGRTTLVAEGRRAELKIGDLFRSELLLK